MHILKNRILRTLLECYIYHSFATYCLNQFIIQHCYYDISRKKFTDMLDSLKTLTVVLVFSQLVDCSGRDIQPEIE